MSNDYFNKLKTKLFPWWKSLNPTKKAAALGSIALVFIMIFFLSSTVFKTDYQVLCKNLESAEAGEIVDYLAEHKIPYRISEGGTAILIASKDIQQTRLELATAGLPKTGIVGYEIFDKTNLGMTDFLQKVNYRRALEGELSKTISHLEEIKAARVHLVIPEPRLFKEDKENPTASIVLYLNQRKPLSERQIEGIMYLVASSVEGLTTDNISVLDSSGKLLSGSQGHDKLAALSSSQLEMQKNVEVYLEDKAQSMLDKVLGNSRSIVRVTAALNFAQAEKTVESYDPDNIAVRSEEINEEKGSETNTDNAPDKKSETSNSKKNTIRNYEVNKSIEHLVNQVGNLTRLHVSVSIDGTYEMVKGPNGKMERQYVPRSQEELDKLIALVKGAVGYSEERNDVLEVANIPFETMQDDWEQKQVIEREEQIQYWVNLGIRGIIAVILVFVLLKIRKKYKEWQERRMAHKRFLDAQAEIQKKAAEIIPRVSKEPKLIDHLRQLADDNPEEIAKAIKTMMVE